MKFLNLLAYLLFMAVGSVSHGDNFLASLINKTDDNSTRFGRQTERAQQEHGTSSGHDQGNKQLDLSAPATHATTTPYYVSSAGNNPENPSMRNNPRSEVEMPVADEDIGVVGGQPVASAKDNVEDILRHLNVDTDRGLAGSTDLKRKLVKVHEGATSRVFIGPNSNVKGKGVSFAIPFGGSTTPSHSDSTP